MARCNECSDFVCAKLEEWEGKSPRFYDAVARLRGMATQGVNTGAISIVGTSSASA